MKRTIQYYDTYKEDIPCTVDDMRLVSATPINHKQKQYECVYRSMSTYELAESIAQKRNAKALEEMKELTYGFYLGGNPYLWGFEQVKIKNNGGVGINKITGQYMHPDLMKMWREKQKREQK
ncbi:hypothetical protein [Klebsiella aerogenes]|uniref:hypothetical protein n=1 Tax=Klebsiella aerogenes TaxID=548 RepID=UPI001865B8CD|nr:hypothetical protein [Klebsiella aerogenes]